MYKAASDMAFSVKRTRPYMHYVQYRSTSRYIHSVFSFKSFPTAMDFNGGRGEFEKGGGGVTCTYMKAKTKELFLPPSAFHLGRFDIKYSWFNLQCSMSIYMYTRYV
jgi:hypothetical protein